jgi:uncharacterized phage-associated protein
MMRRSEEIIVDNLLLLYLIKRANEKGELYGITKLMKLVFLSELKMVREKIKGFNYSFYRWHLGAFTPEIYEDLDYLIENGFVTERQRIELTDEGSILLDEVKELLEKNRNVLRCVDEVVDEFAKNDVYKVMDSVYNIKIEEPFLGVKRKVRDIPEGYYLICRLDESDADEMFSIDEEWIETLDIRLSREAHISLVEAMESARRKRFTRFEEV